MSNAWLTPPKRCNAELGCPGKIIARGMCSKHYERWRRAGGQVRTYKPSRVQHTSEGIKKTCRTCERMLSLAAFTKDDRCKFGCANECRVCTSARSAEYYEHNKDKRRVLAAKYAKNRAKRNRKADRQYQEWIASRKIRTIPADTAREWLKDLVARHGSLIALEGITGLTVKTLGEIAAGRRENITLDTAERLASLAGREAELAQLDPPAGVDNWDRLGNRHCQNCGTWWHTPHALGLCNTCYLEQRRRAKGAELRGRRKRAAV